MLRKLLIASVVAVLVGAPPAAAQKLLMPGVTYDRQVQFTVHGPVVIDVLTGPRPGGLWGLRPALSTESILGTEKLTALEQRLSATETVAGINGDLFSGQDGHPTGFLMRGGGIDHRPLGSRSSLGVDTGGNLLVSQVSLLATWQGSGPRRPFSLVNEPLPASGFVLYTPAWGVAVPAATGTVAAVIEPFPRIPPAGAVGGPVVQVVPAGTAATVPPDGAVLVARGVGSVAALTAEVHVGQTITIRPVLKPNWSSVADAIGGGPVLIRNGRTIFRANEAFDDSQLVPRTARSAAGQLKDGRVVLVTVEGGLPGYSTGMTNFELAQAMQRLGAVTAMALGSGGTAGMAFDGQPLSAPSSPSGEQPLADALLFTYEGVYAATPVEAVLSPNGDGVADKQQLSYKIVRPSSVSVNLLGPDNVPRFTVAGQAEPGVVPLDWSGLRPDGTPEAEGLWRWVVSATDDLGRVSTIERSFSLNLTLGFAKPMGGTLPVPRTTPRVVATFTLTHPATVTTTIETLAGVPLRTLGRVSLQPGPVDVAWDGVTDTGGIAFTGRYLAKVSATNALGTVDLAIDFAVQRGVGGG